MYVAEGDVPCKAWPQMWEPQRKQMNPEAKQRCLRCPELEACHTSTLSWEERHDQVELGVRGGLTEQERGKILAKKRKRKRAA